MTRVHVMEGAVRAQGTVMFASVLRTQHSVSEVKQTSVKAIIPQC